MCIAQKATIPMVKNNNTGRKNTPFIQRLPSLIKKEIITKVAGPPLGMRTPCEGKLRRTMKKKI